jgi:hypothetical protein
MIENLRKQHLINVIEYKSFTIEEARIYSKTKVTQLSNIYKSNIYLKEKAAQNEPPISNFF